MAKSPKKKTPAKRAPASSSRKNAELITGEHACSGEKIDVRDGRCQECGEVVQAPE